MSGDQGGSGIALRSRSIVLGSVRSIQKRLDKVLRAHHTYLEQDEQRLTDAFDVVHLRKLLLTSDVDRSWALSFLDDNPKNCFALRKPLSMISIS
jgi:hypothetical protein